MQILASSFLILWHFFAPSSVYGAYSSSVNAPGTISVGSLVSEVFLSITREDDQAYIEENATNGGFEEGTNGYEGAAVTGFYDLVFEGLTIDSIVPRTGLGMAVLDQDFFEDESTLRFYLPKKTASLRIWANIVSSLNKYLDGSHLVVRVNGNNFAKYGVQMANPYSLSDGYPRQSGYFAVDLDLLEFDPPVEIEIVNIKDPETLLPDFVVLVDDITTSFVNTNGGSTFGIVQTGSFLPLKYFDYGDGFIEGDQFLLDDGEYLINYFAKNDEGKLAATKSAQVEIKSRSLSAVQDLQMVSSSSSSSTVGFSYLRSEDLLTRVFAADTCDLLATAAASFYPMASNGLFELISVPNAACIGVKISDKYGNISPLSNFLQ